jgi:YHS domain-containing protein
MRALVYLVAVVLLVVLVAPILRAWGRSAVAGRATHRDELVKDPVCQTYIVKSRAVVVEADGVVTHFCSRACAGRFARGERRR